MPHASLRPVRKHRLALDSVVALEQEVRAALSPADRKLDRGQQPLDELAADFLWACIQPVSSMCLVAHRAGTTGTSLVAVG